MPLHYYGTGASPERAKKFIIHPTTDIPPTFVPMRAAQPPTTDLIRIRPTRGWRSLDLAGLWEYRDLLYFLTLRDVKAKYAQSILGVGWAIINPLVQTLIFTVIFGNLANLGSDGVPYLLFNFTAMVAWTYFSGILTGATGSLIANRSMLSKIYFPRLILPITSAIGMLIDFGISFLVLIGLLIYYGLTPGWSVLVLPLLLLILLLASLGIGTFLAALAVQFRDVQYAMSLLIRVLIYSAPVVYSIELIPEKWRMVYALNPLVGVIEGMRSIFLHTRPLPWDYILAGGGVALLLFLAGSLYFRRTERLFADVA